MKEGSIGTIIIGIILILSAFVYLDRIIDSVLPIDWAKIQKKEFRNYDADIYIHQLGKEERYRQKGLLEYQKENERLGFTRAAEIGRKKIIERVERWKELNHRFFLMNHPIRLFILFLITMWLLVVGLGFLVIFPWARWFVFLSVTFNYLWQFYTFLYDISLTHLFFSTQNEIHKILKVAPVPRLEMHEDPIILMFVLQTAIFVGIFYYFTSNSGKNLFKESKPTELEEFLTELKEKANSPEREKF